MLREYQIELKNYNFLQLITEGYYLDAKDQGKWKVGKVQTFKKVGHKLCVEVMFDGYAPKYNETYDIPSYSKLAPFRRFTLPYTGLSGQQPRRQQPQKTIQHYIKVLNKLSLQVQNMKSEYINQFLRGQLFVFVDYCLTIVRRETGKYGYEECMRLFWAYVEMYDKVLQRVIEFLKELDKQGNIDQSLIYVHAKMALLYSLTQFFFNCNSMISKKQQRVTFHSHFGKHQSMEQIYVQFVSKFKSHRLYEKCQKLMAWRSVNGGKSLPWVIKKEALILMKSMNLEEKIVLPKQTKEVIEFLEYMPYLTKKAVLTLQQQENYRNELIFHLILNGNFEGKLIGLSEIKRLITSSYYSSKRDAIILQQIKEKNLVGYFLDNNNFNSELFKRSIVLLEYAYKNKLFSKNQFAAVLKLHKDKHELQLQSFYASLAEFGSFLSYPDAIQWFNMMIKELPVQENFIELVKNYTIATVDKNPVFRKACMEKDEQGLGLIYFWEIINSQTKLTQPQLITKAIQGFATLLNNNFFSRQTQRFIVSSIKAIKQMKNPQSFLKVIHQSLKLCKGQRMNRVIQQAQRQINVIETAMTMLRQQENNLSVTGFENLFQFLQEVNSISRKGLTEKDIMFLWKMDKTKARGHLLRFLRKYKLRSNQQKSQQRIIYKSLDITQIQFLIKNIFQSPQLMQNFTAIDQQHYQTIDELILCYLHSKKIIDYNYKHTIRYRKNQFFLEEEKMFLGMGFYLKCIENTAYPEVSVKAIKRLIDIFLRPLPLDWTKGQTEAKVRNWVRLSRAFDGLKNMRLKCFQIQLQEIYGRMKSLNILQPDPIQIKVKQATSGRTHTYSLPRYTSLWKLRTLINQTFSLNNTNFEIQLLQQRTTTTLQRQEDLSIAFIITAKQKNGVSVLVHPSKQMHPHFKAIQKFKQELCEIIGQGLYAKGLSDAKEQKSEMALNILFKLPKLKSILKSVQNLQFKQWQQIIDPHSMKRLQYQLNVIHTVKDMKWIQAFISKNGLKHLAQVVLLNLGKNNYRTINILMSFFIQAIKFLLKNPLPFDEKFLKEILFYQKEKTEEYVLFLLNCFTLIREVSAKVKLATLFEKEKMTQILETVLFNNKKSSIFFHLIEICKINNSFTQLNKHLKTFLGFTFLTTKQRQCRPFFQVIRILIERNQLTHIQQPLQQLLLEVRNSEITQQSQHEVNELLFGYLLCLYELIKANDVFENILAEKKDVFFMYLLKECLFHEKNIALRKFKSKQLRELGFRVLEMLELETQKQSEINKLLVPMMATGAWRRQYDWSIEPVQIVNKKFTGLKNLAATCYMNSLLQQLFHIKNFSSQLMSIDADTIQQKQNIVKQIQNIFGFLKYSQNPSYTTLSLCQTFILDGQPIDPRIQTDVDQFFHALMDKLQRNLSKINKKQIINDVFRGEFSNLIIGQGQCPHNSQRIQYFLSIGLEIKKKKTIYQALDQFIKGEVLEGENAYFCEKCDKKVKALKRVCLKDLPQIMIVTLKRFEFDYDTMQKFKLNTYCSFPEQINFLPYTKQGLQQDPDVKKEDYEYKLKGVVIHYGISQAGHYTSYVRTDEERWNYFDDERISQFSPSNLEKQCFGGIEENPFGDDEEKKKNAYLLIYEKVKPPSDQLKQIPSQFIAQSKVFKLVQQDNIKTKLVNLLFQPNIENYMFNSSQLNSRTFLIYFHTVFVRNSKRRDRFVQFYNKCAEILAKKQHAQWYLRQINEGFLQEFVLYGDYEVKYVVTSLVCLAVKNAVDVEFLQQCVALLYTKSIVPFVKIFAHAYNAHPQYAKYLTMINLSQVVLNLIKGKQIKQTNAIRKAQTRKQLTEFGSSMTPYTQRKTCDSKDLLQAIESMKSGMTLDQIKQLAMKIKTKRTLKSLAIITAKKYKQLDQLKKLNDTFLANELFTFDPKTGEQTYYWFLIQVVEQLCKIVDKQQQKRVIFLSKLYINVMGESVVGFRAQLMLFSGLFRMALANLVFRNAVSVLLSDKENKKVTQMLKDWLKQLPNVIPNIKSEKWGWWRKAKKQYPGLTARDVQNEVKPNVKQALSLLNAIIQKHQLELAKETLQVDSVGYMEQKYGPEFVKVTRRMGLLVEVKDQQGVHKFVSEDQVVKTFV